MASSTKDRIVEAATELFNEAGVAAVTTNHIAAHLGISPGNLYYHFANKEEIVRDAFRRMNAEADAVWGSRGDSRAVDPSALQRIVVGNLRLYSRWLFFARELPALLRADPELRAEYVAVAQRRMDELESLLGPLVEAGLLKNLSHPEDLRALVESAWMIGMFSIPFAETLQAPSRARSTRARRKEIDAAVERGALLVLHLFQPYMDPLAYSALVVLVRSQLEESADGA